MCYHNNHCLLSANKLFVRPHPDFGDIIYDQTFNNSFHCNLDGIQYNTGLVIKGAIRDT